MSEPNYSEQQLQEINELEHKCGFPGLIAHAHDPDLTDFQRQHAANWLKIANRRFGDELRNQLGRLPTLEELTDRLALSLDMHRVGDGRTVRPAKLTQ